FSEKIRKKPRRGQPSPLSPSSPSIATATRPRRPPRHGSGWVACQSTRSGRTRLLGSFFYQPAESPGRPAGAHH
ncbi:MAG: hypothetical protein WKG07_34225, partial [Hymenobacter sp.]